MLKHHLSIMLIALLCSFGNAGAQNTIFSYKECPNFLQYSPIVKIYAVPKDSVLSVIYGSYNISPDHSLLQRERFSVKRERLDSLLSSDAVTPGHYLYVTIDQNNVTVHKYNKTTFAAHILDMGFTSLLEVSDRNDQRPDSSATVHMNGKQVLYDHEYQAYVIPYVKQGDTIVINKGADVHYYFANVQKQPSEREYYNRYGYGRQVEKKYRGYVVTNKPKYMPGDTVKWKAYLLDPVTGQPSIDTLILKMSDQVNYAYKYENTDQFQTIQITGSKKGRKNNKKGSGAARVIAPRAFDDGNSYGTNYLIDMAVAPTRPGVYFDEFVLSDSMDIDRNYNMILIGNDQNRLHTSFVYQDYLLNDMRIKVKGDEYTTYQNGDSIKLYVYASTANNLPMMDGKVWVTVRPHQVFFEEGKRLFPDTVFHQEVTVDPSGETVFAIPTGKLIDRPTTMSVFVTAMNSVNERKDTSFTIQYLGAPYYLRGKQTGNIVRVEMIRNQKSVKGAGFYTKSNINEKYSVQFPCEIKVGATDQLLTFWMDSVYTNKFSTSLYQYLDDDKLSSATDYVKDTAYLQINNPQKAFVRLSIYSGSQYIGLARTSNDTLLKIYNKDGETVTVKACYTWKNWQEKTFTIYKYDKDINIDVHKKDIVYPGQTDSISIRLSDKEGQPIRNTNLTVLAFNNQFAEDFVPELPYSGVLKDGVPMDTTRMLSPFNIHQIPTFKLMDKKWVSRAGADTTFLYQQILVNPRSNTWIKYKLNDSLPSQMSVHIMENGVYHIPEIIYVDGEPVFYRPANMNSANNHNGFNIGEGRHTIKVRLPGNEYTIRDVNIAAHTSLVLFINGDVAMPASISKNTISSALTGTEQNTLRDRYVIFKPEYKGDAGEDIDIFGNKVANGNIAIHNGYRPYMSNYMIYFQQNERSYVSNYHNRYSSGYYQGNGYNYQSGEVFLAGPFLTGSPITFYQYNNTKQEFYAEPGSLFVFRDGMQRVEKVDPNIYLRAAQHVEYWPDMCYKVPQTMPDLDTFVAKLKPDTLYPRYDVFQNFTERKGADSSALQLSFRNTGYNYNYNYSNTSSNDAYFVFSNKNEYIRIPITNNGSATMKDVRPGEYSIELVHRNVTIKLNEKMTIKKGQATHLTIAFSKYLKKEAAEAAQKEIVIAYKNPAVTTIQHIDPNAPANSSISGTATDENGDPVIGAVISIYSGGIKKGGAATDIDGNYIIKPLRAGTYEVIATYSSYKRVRITGIIVSNDGIARVNINFRPDALQEVTIMYQRPLISNSGRVNTSFAAEDIKNAPTRDLTKLVATSAGMVDNGRDGTINAGGARGGNTITMLDGTLIRGAVPNVAQGTVSEVFEGTSKEFMAEGNTQAFISEFIVNQLLASGLRNNFRDYAIWEPNLWTDKDGETHFTVTYPDNITGWKTYVLAMNEHNFSGRALQMTNAFKPLSAQLSMPRFLRYGDTVYGIGKVSNYTPQAFSLQSSFLQNGVELARERITVNNIKVSPLQITAPVKNSTDTGKIVATYSIKADNGFIDGEEKKVPVYFVGTTESTGIFTVLPRDTMIHSQPDSSKPFTGASHIMVDGSLLDVMLREIENLKLYPYGCIEQLTTKLMAISYEEEVKRILRTDSVNNADTRDSIINQLVRKQNPDGSFGWWNEGIADLRITNYVINTMSRINNDHKLDEIIRQGLQYLTNNFVMQEPYYYLHTLKTLSDHKVDLNYGYLLKSMNDTVFSQHDSFIVASIRKANGLPYREWLDSLVKSADKRFGYSWGRNSYDWASNDLATTLLAYKMIDGDSVYGWMKDGITRYLLHCRRGGYYQNTAEAGQVLTTILPELMLNAGPVVKDKYTKIEISGTINKIITSFPQTMMSRDKNIQLDISKTGLGPAYVSVVYSYLKEEPEVKDDVFDVRSYFVTGRDTVEELKAGVNTTLHVTVKCDTVMDYVMVEVPIPAGCVQTASTQYHPHFETNRDNFKDKTVICCTRLQPGIYTFDVQLEVRYKGSFNMNPARASMMYYPDKYGNNRVKRVRIK